MKELIIPYGTLEINDQNDNEYERIIIPSTVKTINNSFNNSTNLKEVVFQTEVDDNEEVKGIVNINKSFNKTGISKIVFPVSIEDIRTSFSNNPYLEKINFKYEQKEDSKIKGIEKILLDSFDNIPIKSIVIPPSIRTVDSSFKDCSKLKDLLFKTLTDDKGNEIGIKKLTNNSFYNIPALNITMPRTLKLNTSQLPVHAVRFDRGSSITFKKDTSKKIKPVFVVQASKKIKSTNVAVYDYSNGCIMINENGKTNEINIDKNISNHNQASAIKLMLKNFNIQVDNNQNNSFILSVTGTYNNILTIQINGEEVTMFFPDEITEEQYSSLKRIINKMKQSEINNNKKFNITLYHKELIYNKEENGNIKTDDIEPFINENLMNTTHKL